MAYKADKELKRYYSIKEVSEMMGVTEPTLRFWESQFPMLKPKKTATGVRQYTKEDIEVIRLIYHLVKEKGLTIKGALTRLKTSKESTLQVHEVVERLKEVREELMALKEQLDGLEEGRIVEVWGAADGADTRK